MVQNRILKKKAKNTENPKFCEFQKVIKWPESVDGWLKNSGLPQSLSRIFYLSQTQKLMILSQKQYAPKNRFFLRGRFHST